MDFHHKASTYIVNQRSLGRVDLLLPRRVHRVLSLIFNINIHLHTTALTSVYNRFHSVIAKDLDFTGYHGDISAVLKDKSLPSISAYWELPSGQQPDLYGQISEALQFSQLSSKPIRFILTCTTLTRPDFRSHEYMSTLPDHIRFSEPGKYKMDIATVMGVKGSKVKNTHYVSIFLLENISAQEKWRINHNVYFTLMRMCMRPYGTKPHILSRRQATEARGNIRKASVKWYELEQERSG